VRLKEEKNTPPDTPIQPEPTPTAVLTPVDHAPVAASHPELGGLPVETEASVTENFDEVPTPADVEQTTQAQQDIPQPSIEVSRVRHIDEVQC
jgi:hypothetical protein